MVSAMVSNRYGCAYYHNITTHLKDPDAPVREKKPLSDLDMVRICTSIA